VIVRLLGAIFKVFLRNSLGFTCFLQNSLNSWLNIRPVSVVINRERLNVFAPVNGNEYNIR